MSVVLDANVLLSALRGHPNSPSATLVAGDKDLLGHADLTPKAISPREACEQLSL